MGCGASSDGAKGKGGDLFVDEIEEKKVRSAATRNRTAPLSTARAEYGTRDRCVTSTSAARPRHTSEAEGAQAGSR